MHAVNIVIADYLHNAGDHPIPRGGYAGIDDKSSGGRPDPFRMLFVYAFLHIERGLGRIIGIHRYPVRVEPCMYLQIALMGLIYGEPQRIEPRVLTIATGQIPRPRDDGRPV